MIKIEKKSVEQNEITIIHINLENIRVKFMDYGARVLNIETPNKDNLFEEILLEYKDLNDYIENDMYMNAIVGPSSGRIKDGCFTIKGNEYQVEQNELNINSLHSGKDGISYKFFNYSIVEDNQKAVIEFKIITNSGESLFPGNQNITIRYTVSNEGLEIEFCGTTDKESLLNLTSHLYINLSGNLKDNILDHKLCVDTDKVVMVDSLQVPNGLFHKTLGDLDFTKMKSIKKGLSKDILSRKQKGIDDVYYFEEVRDSPVASLYEESSGRLLEVFTTYKSLVVYTHNHPNNKDLKHIESHPLHYAICLETQNIPNGINLNGFENSILKPRDVYHHRTMYKFSVKKKDD